MNFKVEASLINGTPHGCPRRAGVFEGTRSYVRFTQGNDGNSSIGN